jgi:hypothetical protein
MRRPQKTASLASLAVLLVLVSIGVAYGVVRAAQGPEPPKPVVVSETIRSDHGKCREAEGPPSKVPQGLFGPAHRVLVNSTVIGCGRRLGSWFRLVAYLQADHRARQLCYGLEQPSSGAKSGGGCVHVSSAYPICRTQCRLALSGLNPGQNETSKVTVVSGVIGKRVRNLTLLIPGRSLSPRPRPIAAVIDGSLARKFGLREVVSVFAYLIEPCLTASETASVVAGIEGGRNVHLRGVAPAECG